MVAGPMWLVVAPPAANRLLAGSDRARRMAVGEHRLPDGGAVWQPQDYRLDSGPAGAADSIDPVVRVGDGAIHVVWSDLRFGPRAALYYRRLFPH